VEVEEKLVHYLVEVQLEVELEMEMKTFSVLENESIC